MARMLVNKKQIQLNKNESVPLGLAHPPPRGRDNDRRTVYFDKNLRLQAKSPTVHIINNCGDDDGKIEKSVAHHTN
eukprot:2083401-Amphidinium_carterae.1